MTDTTTPAQRHKMALEFIVQEYQHGMIVALCWLFQSGEVPSLETVTPTVLRRFFESTNPGYWVSLMQTDPAEAMAQLVQFHHAMDKTGGEDEQPDTWAHGAQPLPPAAAAAPITAGVA